MKKKTHVFAGIVAALAGVLCLAPVHAAMLSFASRDPYLSVIVGAILALAALYHDPKRQAE